MNHRFYRFCYRVCMMLLLCLAAFSTSFAQDLKAFRIYDKKGREVSFSKMIQELKRYDVVLFGEYHNNSIIHWLELRTAESLYGEVGGRLELGAEMFERDNQGALNRYLADSIDEKTLEAEARLWPNFKTDYEPLVDFAKENKLKFVATNIPRRYAQMVAKGGMDTLNSLPESEQAYMAKMPVKVDLATPGYKEMESMMKAHAGDKIMNFISAQAIKDATMAESILKNKKRKDIFLHFNGNYHSKDYGGIYWYLMKEKKWLQRLKVAVISVTTSKDRGLSFPENFKATEFNIVVPDDMTKTY